MRASSNAGIVWAAVAGLALLGGPAMAGVGPESGPNDVYWDDNFQSLGVDAAVHALGVDRFGSVYVGGKFSLAGEEAASKIAKWNGSGWSLLGSGLNNMVQAVAVYDLVYDGVYHSTNVYAGGTFTAAGGSAANRVARWNSGGGWSTLGIGMNSPVLALATYGPETLYAGGSFSTAGGTTALYVAKWNTVAEAWSALGTGVGGGTTPAVNALAVDGAGNLYAGGDFTMAGGVAANRIAKWNGSAWTALGSGMNNIVYALAMDASGNLYAGGNFTTAGGATANRVAKWDGTAWSALGTGMNNRVYSLAFDLSGGLYAGGSFTTAGGVTVNSIAKWNGTAWSAIGSGVDQLVRAVAVDRNNLFAGGEFTMAGGKDSDFFAVWQPRVNQRRLLYTASPGALTLGNDAFGFYKPMLRTFAGTTVSYPGGLPVVIPLTRADEIQVGGIRVNGAFTLEPNGVQFGGSPTPTLRVEFSEDDAAAYGVTYSEFRAVKLTYPANYPTSKEAASYVKVGLGTEVPGFIRGENGKQIYAITVPIAAIGSTYAALPPPAPPSNPGVLNPGFDTLRWTWQDNSSNETGFKVYADPGAGPPVTLRTTTAMNTGSWPYNGLNVNSMYAFQVAATNPVGDSPKTTNFTAWTLIEPLSGLGISGVTDTSITVTPEGSLSNLTAGFSGVRITNFTAGTTTDWVQNMSPWISNGLSPNTQHFFIGGTRNGAGLQGEMTVAAKFTLARTPTAPEVTNPGDRTLDVAIGAGDANPADTLYVIQMSPDLGGNSWVQADGTLGALAVYRTAAGWGVTTVTGLDEYAEYAFSVMALNGENIPTAFGPSASNWTLDVTLPTGGLVINDGSEYTTSPEVTLTCSAEDLGSGIAEMRFSEDNAVWGEWEAFAANKAWTFLGADGPRILYVEYRDASGNVSVGEISDEIILDTAPPTATITLDDPTPTGSDVLHFSVDFSESVGTSFALVSLTGTVPGLAEIIGADANYDVTLTLTDPDADGPVGISVGTEVTDLAGNPYAGGASPMYEIANWHGFLVEPEDARMYTADALLFEVVVAPNPAGVTYQWKWDNGIGAVQEGPDSALWPLDDLTAANRGQYWCEVSHEGITYTTFTATLFVEDHLQITVPPAGGEAIAGDPYTFFVETSGGYMPLTYIWSREGTIFPDSNNSSYLIPKLAESDTGVFTVEVMDANTDYVTASADLLVLPRLPVAGFVGLGVLLCLVAIGGARTMRKK